MKFTHSNKKKYSSSFLLMMMLVGSALTIFTLTLTNNVKVVHALDPFGFDQTGNCNVSTGAGRDITCIVSLTTTHTGEAIMVFEYSPDSFTGNRCDTNAPTDNKGNTYTERNSIILINAFKPACEYKSFWSSSGAINITCRMTNPNPTGGEFGCEVGTISGVNGIVSDTHSGLPCHTTVTTTTSISCNVSTSFANDLILGFTAVDNNAATISAGTGYTIPSGGCSRLTSSSNDQICIEYKNVTSTQTNLAVSSTFSASSDAGLFGDAVIALFQPGDIEEKVTITPHPHGYNLTATITGCSISPTTILMDGTQYFFIATQSCSLTFTVPSTGLPGSNDRMQFAGQSNTWVYTTGSTTAETKSNNVYFESTNNYYWTPYSPITWDTTYSVSVVGELAGTPGVTICSATLTVATVGCLGYADSSVPVVMTSQFGTWSNMSTTTFIPPVASTQKFNDVLFKSPNNPVTSTILLKSFSKSASISGTVSITKSVNAGDLLVVGAIEDCPTLPNVVDSITDTQANRWFFRAEVVTSGIGCSNSVSGIMGYAVASTTGSVTISSGAGATCGPIGSSCPASIYLWVLTNVFELPTDCPFIGNTTCNPISISDVTTSGGFTGTTRLIPVGLDFNPQNAFVAATGWSVTGAAETGYKYVTGNDGAVMFNSTSKVSAPTHFTFKSTNTNSFELALGVDISALPAVCSSSTSTPQQQTLSTILNFWPIWLFPLVLGGLFGMIGVFIGFIIGITMGFVIGVIPIWVNVLLLLGLTFITVRREV